jgi:AraC-like DNA-binding protein
MSTTVPGAGAAVLEESVNVDDDATTSTRGILRPEALGRQFALTRTLPPADLADVIERHWVVQWDLRGREPYRSEVITHPCVNLCFELHGAHVYGVQRPKDARTLSGSGWCVGTKFRPGAFAGFVERPISQLTDRFFAVAELFGADGAALAAAGESADGVDAKLALHHDFVRAQRPAPDAAAELVREVVRDMLTADPGVRVEQIARRHAVSPRTLQRLFADRVGVSPKWVLQRYRLHEAAERLASGESRDWARVALELGYFDQAHFIRDFRAFVGRSPTQYVRECAALLG